MGSHGVGSGKTQAGRASRHARETANVRLASPRALALRDWPVSWRLIMVIVMALVMGLVFGGLRVAAAADSASAFGRVSQLAHLGQQVTGLVQALENERDQTAGVIPSASTQAAQAALSPWYRATDEAAASVRREAAGIGGSFPANIQSRVARVLSVINHLGQLRTAAQASQSALAVIAEYSAPIGDMISLNDQMAQGTADAGLASAVQTLNSLSLAKDEAAQQRSLLFNSLTQQIFADGELAALTTAESDQFTDVTAFSTTASSAEQKQFRTEVAGPAVDHAELIEQYVISVDSLDLAALNISAKAAPAQWYAAMSDTVDKMQAFELGVAGSIVSRADILQQQAEHSALLTALITAAILLLVLITTIAVARSLVRPLRRLREGALDIAAVQLPERVKQLSEAPDPAAGLDVLPIDVLSADEIGQVARAFDQVHAEAIRLASNEAILRGSFNAMFVNLSRRSQLLIERLARLIDTLEQNEDDPSRLSSLFSMDHLVTRMRRNSENLLLLAGHEGARKWSEPVPLSDVARAATSEIEQYSRVTQRIVPGASVSGQAASDIVHLLAEIMENATIFSPKDTMVQVSASELTTGGLLIEVSDSGVGIPESRLAEINTRLDDPPVIDVSVSRHMGLFAVARLADRHGVRVRLVEGSPAGLTALVWLPDDLIERGTQLPRMPAGWYRDNRPSEPGAGNVSPAGRAPAGRAPAGRVPAGGPFSGGPFAGSSVAGGAGGPGAGSSVAGGPGGAFAAAAQGPGYRPSGNSSWADSTRAAQIVEEPVYSDSSAAGLPLRVPRANLLPGSADRGPRMSAGPQPGRSPQTARTRLTGFQRGTRRARGPVPGAEEGTDR